MLKTFKGRLGNRWSSCSSVEFEGLEIVTIICGTNKKGTVKCLNSKGFIVTYAVQWLGLESLREPLDLVLYV